MAQWNIGDVKITRIIESESAWPGTWLLPDATADRVKQERSGKSWLSDFTDEAGKFRLSIHALVLESQGKRIIVDTCIGNDKIRKSNPEWSNLKLPFMDDLKAAGFTADQVDHVVCTHLHVDHVGWNTKLVDGKWVPTFGKAQYVIGGTEWDFFSKMEDAFMKDPVDDSVRPVIDRGQAKLVDSNHKITDEVWLEPTPGHTPGHHSVRISSKGQNAVITGDLMHHPVQCAYPEWDDAFDSDGAMAKKTRRAFCEKYADSGVIVFGTHFASPSCGNIQKEGSAFRFVAHK